MYIDHFMMPLVQIIQHFFKDMTTTYAQVTQQVGILPKALNTKSFSKGGG